MKQFTVTRANQFHGGTDIENITADHYSVSSAGPHVVAHFYRKPATDDTPKDELVTSVREPDVISLDEKAFVIEAEIADLSDPILDKLAEFLRADELEDDQKIRLVVTLTE